MVLVACCFNYVFVIHRPTTALFDFGFLGFSTIETGFPFTISTTPNLSGSETL